jgi:hypothetical protein
MAELLTQNGHFPWTVTDGSAADLDGAVNGDIRTSWYVDPDDSAFSSFTLTADGLLSGLSASTTFTDAPAADLDHFGNVSGEWLDGLLGSNKASYLEGQSVPDRIIFTDLTPGVSYFITIAYDTTKSGKHAFDYLTTYDRTVSPDPLDGTTGVNATVSTFAIPVDDNVTKGQNGIDDGPVGPTGGDDIAQIAGIGGTITAVSGYTRSPNNYVTDSTTTITVTFTPRTSVLAWELTSPPGKWGQTTCCCNYRPYHVSSRIQCEPRQCRVARPSVDERSDHFPRAHHSHQGCDRRPGSPGLQLRHFRFGRHAAEPGQFHLGRRFYFRHTRYPGFQRNELRQLHGYGNVARRLDDGISG